MKKGLLSLFFMMLIMINCGGVVKAARCPLCGSKNMTISYQQYSASKHKKIYNCPASTGCGGGTDYESHSFGSWTSNGYGVSHSRTCSVCNYKQSESHSYGSWRKTNENQHRRDCSKCNSYGVENHTTTTGATCTSAAYCGTCRSNFGSALGHSWGSYEANGSTGHRRKCTNCGTYEATVSHVNFELGLAISDGENYHSNNCSVCKYEINRAKHNWVIDEAGVYTEGKYYHIKTCNICNAITVVEECTFTSTVTQNATCTSTGIRRRTCTICNFSYNQTIDKIDHSWTDWQTTSTEHWKVCNYGCGTENSRGTHIDTNPRNGRCDTCNYLMYILPEANISSDVTVKEGETANFSVTMTQGSQPLTYQWYYKTSSSGTGTAISGATSSSYSVTTTKAMNGRYYYCIVSNPGGDYTTASAFLTVYYTFTLGTQPQNVNLKKGETGTFTVGIGTTGNPNSYTYQWYIANSATGAGSKINNATNSSYSVTPTKNIHEEYYYCVVTNGQYTVTSNRAKLTADITEPDITMGSFNQNVIINNTATLKIPFTVSDTGEGYTENNSNFTASDIVVKIGGVANNSLTKTLNYTGASGNNYNYELTITNINGNGKLSFEVPAGSIADNFHNTNTLKSFSTNVTIDNIAPVITLDTITGDLNGKYINSEDEIVIRIIVTEAVGMNTSEFTVDDIIVKVGGSQANSDVEKTLSYVEKNGNNYVYELTLGNIQGDGELTLEIPASSIKDTAGNSNIDTNLSIKVGTENLIVDNTKPVINSLVTTLGGYNSSSDYPSSIDARHNNWSNENIYVQINATDDKEIDCYMKSVGNNTNYTKLASYQEIISDSVEAVIYYKVVDMAGNYAEISKLIKLDKTTPNKPVMSLFEQRQNGVIYVFDPNNPSDKSVYVIPNASTIVDAGSVKSGIEKDVHYTYYTVTAYKDITKAVQVGTTITYEWNEGVLLNESGYYEIMIMMTDIAGNSILGDIYKVYIDKKAENTIKISNITDIGSGINKVTIRVYKSDDAGNKTLEEAIEAIVITNPYKEIIKNVMLGNGKFYVEVTLQDKVGLETVLKKTITNVL